MINCTIIGAGQVGSRHLQALSNLESPTRIDLVDPSGESLKIAQGRYEEVSSKNKKHIQILYHNNLANLPNKLDLVIISTNSIVREKIIKEVVKKNSVKNLILEKILFQRSAQYAEIEHLLKKSSIPTWVSCWMRTTNLFKQIKNVLNLNHSIKIKVEGTRWGMATASIHFMDLLYYLTECNNFKFIKSNLNKEVRDAKRSGFKEFFGCLSGENSRGDSLNLTCNEKGGDRPIKVTIKNGPETYELLMSDVTTHFDFESSDGLKNKIKEECFPYQSEMTHIWVNDILSKGHCDLPTYSNSSTLHLELIRVLTEHLKKITGETNNVCPIT